MPKRISIQVIDCLIDGQAKTVHLGEIWDYKQDGGRGVMVTDINTESLIVRSGCLKVFDTFLTTGEDNRVNLKEAYVRVLIWQ